MLILATLLPCVAAGVFVRKEKTELSHVAIDAFGSLGSLTQDHQLPKQDLDGLEDDDDSDYDMEKDEEEMAKDEVEELAKDEDGEAEGGGGGGGEGANAVVTSSGGLRQVWCNDGIQFQEVCCAKSCGTCGGTRCGSREGGAGHCCTGTIRASLRKCTTMSDVGCLVPGARRPGTRRRRRRNTMKPLTKKEIECQCRRCESNGFAAMKQQWQKAHSMDHSLQGKSVMMESAASVTHTGDRSTMEEAKAKEANDFQMRAMDSHAHTANSCINPASDDPDRFKCECMEEGFQKCKGQNLDDCLRALLCNLDDVCQEWKKDSQYGRCDSMSLMARRGGAKTSDNANISADMDISLAGKCVM